MSQNRHWTALAVVACISFVLAVLTGCRSTRQAQVPAGPRFTLATYNIYYKSKRPDLTCDVIRGAGADVVLLQEITSSLATVIRSSLQDRYPYMRFRPDHIGGGMGVISRFPFEDVASVPSPVNGFFCWLFDVATPVGDVEVLAVHLDPDVNECDEFSPVAYLKGHRRRLAEMKAYVTFMCSEGPRIVAGDFNEDNDGTAVKFLKANGYTDALPGFNRWSPTWALWWPIPLISTRLDHILYSAPLQCYDARILGNGGSDHKAVVASFTVAPTTQNASRQENGAAPTEPIRHADATGLARSP